MGHITEDRDDAIARIYLRRGKEESLLRRHPWIFSGALERIECAGDGIAEGEIVDVYTSRGEFIARGHYQIGSIAVRVLAFERVAIDRAWWCGRIGEAYALRRALSLTDNPS